MSLHVTVKWMGKQAFENLELDTNESPAVFKAQLYALSGVPPDRIKLSLKGKMIKDEAAWKDYNVASGAQFTMMGTAEEVKVPDQKPVFMEDLPAEAAAALQSNLPAGLANLGNTCYMNSTIEVLRCVPELKSRLLSYNDTSRETNALLTTEMRNLLGRLEMSTQAVEPMSFFAVLRQAFPNFAQTGPHGENLQQDADECLSQLLSALSQNLRLTDASAAPAAAADSTVTAPKTAIEDLFGIQLDETTVSKIPESEPPLKSTSSILKLSCYIRSTMSHLSEGIHLALKEDIEKMSSVRGQLSQYTKTSAISRLPPYMLIQFVRFEWKAGAGKEKAGVKAKILKRINFPFYLDAYEFCTDSLKARLTARRSELAAAGALPSLPPVKCTDTGFYELAAVLTHIGREADSGHYMAWVKQDNGKWLKYDDDTVTEQPEEEIQKLTGGGDWHIAYVCLYRATTSKDKPQPAKKVKMSSD